MSQLLAMSFDSAVSPSITLSPSEAEGNTGWGFAWYPADEYAAAVVKDPHAKGDTAVSGVLRDWDRFRSSVFLCHVRGAAQFRTLENTQPFSRSFGGRDWVMAHNGNLDPIRARKLNLGNSPAFQPVGRTDTEHAFCWLLNRVMSNGHKDLSDIGWETLHEWLSELNRIGTANFLLTDGKDLVVYQDEDGFNPLWATRRLPPHPELHMENDVLKLELDDPRDVNRTLVLLASSPLSPEGWHRVPNNSMLVLRRSSIMWSSAPDFNPTYVARPSTEQSEAQTTTMSIGGTPAPPAQDGSVAAGQTQAQIGLADVSEPTIVDHTKTSLPEHPVPEKAPRIGPPAEREMLVRHETTYRYAEPVEKSISTLRLRPVQDFYQQVLSHTLTVSVDGTQHDYEDVFGNPTTRLEINIPYTELHIVSESTVRLRANTELHAPMVRSTLPLVWMPWQRQMMVPYLLPPELPESQLHELTEFAMSFVERQDYELVSTLLDINTAIRRDFAYVSGSTHLGTTPFDVYVNRRGVCQDFANLFICLARLVGIPARYRVGYVYTGADYDNQIQSEASHAWVEVYLPVLGWRGFDPTNGCLAGTDHVRVAAGRNYRDGTPTGGTIFKGGGQEILNVSVRVEPLQQQQGQTPS